MKLNWAERWVVNNPLRVMAQRLEIGRFRGMASLSKGARVLEVGCGRGAGAKLILRAFKPSSLYAMDLDMHMVQKARAYLSAQEQKKISLYVGDVLRLPLREGSLDAVFGFGVLHHVPDWRGAAAEIGRVLKTGGVFFMEDLYPTFYQNFITGRILVHPTQDRFFSHDLRQALKHVGLPIKDALDLKKVGILAVAIKEA